MAQFEGIGLHEMAPTKTLMSRVDIKYVIKKDLLIELLNQLKEIYYIVKVNDKAALQYNTIYFDTPQQQFYLSHQNGKKNRYKIRARHYLDTDTKFFEVKYKNNQGRTIKTRVPLQNINENSLGPVESAFLNDNFGFNANQFKPQMWVKYQRITLVHKLQAERVTIDLNLCFENNQKQKIFDTLAIIEVKQDKFGRSAMVEVLQKSQQKPGSISKYCWASCELFPGIKKNNFKAKLNKINKLIVA